MVIILMSFFTLYIHIHSLMQVIPNVQFFMSFSRLSADISKSWPGKVQMPFKTRGWLLIWNICADGVGFNKRYLNFMERKLFLIHLGEGTHGGR